MNTQQNHQTNIQNLKPAKQGSAGNSNQLGKYTLLVGDFHKGSPYLTMGPNHLIFGFAFIVFNLLAFTISYRMNKVQEMQAFFIVLNAITLLVDVLWLATALINPGIASQETQNGEQLCEICQKKYQIEIAKKHNRAHCLQCDICIDKHEHHFKWVGCCIGKNNCLVFKFLLLAIVLWGLTLITVIPLTYNQ